MRFLFLVGLVVLAAAPADAQSDGRRKYLALIIGPAVPIRGYADAPTSTPGAGPARPGYLDTFANFAYRRSAKSGIAVSFAYGEFDMASPGDDDWWQVSTLTIGPMYFFPLAEKFDLELKAKVGWMGTAEIIDSFLNDRGDGFALDVRSGLRYDVFRRWSGLAEVGVMASRQSFRRGGHKTVEALISGIGVAYRW